MNKKRIKMVCKLQMQEIITNHCIKNVVDEDKERIAKAMLDSYMGTVDQMENTFEEAFTEVKNIFNHGYGKFVAEASFLAEQNNDVASVILLNLYEDKPLITEVFTGKKYYRQGLAGNLIKTSMNALYGMGYEELFLYVNEENIDAIKLYKRLRFKIVE